MILMLLRVCSNTCEYTDVTQTLWQDEHHPHPTACSCGNLKHK